MRSDYAEWTDENVAIVWIFHGTGVSWLHADDLHFCQLYLFQLS